MLHQQTKFHFYWGKTSDARSPPGDEDEPHLPVIGEGFMVNGKETDNPIKSIPHHPITKKEEDDLQFGAHVDAVYEHICGLTLNDSGSAIGIYGDWGSGKSSFLNLLDGKMRAEQGKKPPFIVRFDASRYAKQEEIWIALLRKIIFRIEEENYIELLKLNWRLWKKRLGNNPDFFSALISKIPESSDFILRILLSLVSGYKTTLTQKIDLPIKPLTAPPVDKGEPILVDNFQDEFNEVVKFVAETCSPIVVLIDDLDRAPANQIVPTLEAIKHFGLEPNGIPFVFIIAVDPQMIRWAIIGHYKDIWGQVSESKKNQRANDYLGKIINPKATYHLAAPREVLKNLLPNDPALITVRSVLTNGPKGNAREVVQAYNTFYLIWAIVEKRKFFEVDIDHAFLRGILAALVVIQDSCPDIFQQFLCYPELFFDLHTLARKESNQVCLESEVEEILSPNLGCPKPGAGENKPAAMIESFINSNHPVLALLGTFTLDRKFGVNELFYCLTLLKEPAPSASYLIESSWALWSGDPSLIKYAARVSSIDVYEKRLPQLIDFLWKTDSENDLTRAIFALGKLKSSRAIGPLKQLLKDKNRSLSIEAKFRAVYALALTICNKRINDNDRLSVVEALIDIIVTDGEPQDFRGSVIRLLAIVNKEKFLGPYPDAYIEREKNIRDVLAQVARRDDIGEISATAEKILSARTDWLQDLIARAPETVFAIFDKTLVSLPNLISEYLVDVASVASQLQNRALDILSKDQDAQKAMEYMMSVVSKTIDTATRRKAIVKTGERQRDIPENWQSLRWDHLQTELEAPMESDDWIAFAESLGITGCLEAIPYLKDMASEHSDGRADIRVFRTAKGSVKRVSEIWLKIERDPKEWAELLKAIGVQAIPDSLQKIINESQKDVKVLDKTLKEIQSLADNKIESDFQNLRPNTH
ncbi:hypothetical protein HY772_04235 [Candidatus Woesearchaeota archaeon]|nr:hypothetical protein [Candidatus Woesearchaeota archaeon]